MGRNASYTKEIDDFIVKETEQGKWRSKAEAFRTIAETLDLRVTQVSARYYLLRPETERVERTSYTPEMDTFIFKEGLHPKGSVGENFKRIADEMGLKRGAVQARFYDMAAKRIPRPEGYEDYEYNYKRTPSKRTQKNIEAETVEAESQEERDNRQQQDWDKDLLGHELSGYKYKPNEGRPKTPFSIPEFKERAAFAGGVFLKGVNKLADIEVEAEPYEPIQQRESDLEAFKVKARYDALEIVRADLLMEQVKFISDSKLVEVINNLNKELYKRLKP